MISLPVSINKRRYAISCNEADQDHVKTFAARIDEKARVIGEAIGDASEAQVLVLTAITLVNDLENAEKKLVELENELEQVKAQKKAAENSEQSTPKAEQEEFVKSLENMASRMENLATQLKSA